MGLNFVIKQHKSKMELVYETLKEAIVNGKWKPGERKNANEIAKQLLVSTTPIMEAGRLLEMEGLLKILPQVGLEVPLITIKEVQEMMSIRGALEALATVNACRHLTERDFDKIEELVRAGEQYVRQGNYKRYTPINKEFHQFIYRSSGLPHLITLLDRHYNNGNRYCRYFDDMPECSNSSAQDHRTILNTLKNRDEKKAKAAVEGHSERFIAALTSRLKEIGIIE